ncbi:hypothetical protein KFK09_002364 [Dendrobium nobile]|uniref:Uncharacterized protein n=1 Tax=Dendrobium nobile TaxID=94219 RepID=A0A8T3C710_DENNO|nr:hypothetical protein KFK09_002364 [Dendrobium nobile]
MVINQLFQDPNNRGTYNKRLTNDTIHSSLCIEDVCTNASMVTSVEILQTEAAIQHMTNQLSAYMVKDLISSLKLFVGVLSYTT